MSNAPFYCNFVLTELPINAFEQVYLLLCISNRFGRAVVVAIMYSFLKVQQKDKKTDP